MESKTRGTHYSLAQAPKSMAFAAMRMGQAMIEEYEDSKRIPVIAYSGMSGIATATAIALYLEQNHPDFVFHMVYVRKQGEQSHGSRIEHNFAWLADHDPQVTECDLRFYIAFVDDLICTGDTRNYVVEKIKEQAAVSPYHHFSKLVMVECITYCTDIWRLKK